MSRHFGWSAKKTKSNFPTGRMGAPPGRPTMKCPKCQHFNDVAAKFCAECASPLALTCMHCSQPILATAKFCSECGRPTGVSASATLSLGAPATYTPRHLVAEILKSKTALEGERKQVTVLFADL